MDKYQDLNPNLEYFVYTHRDTSWGLNDLLRVHALTFILEGSVDYEIEGKKYTFKKNDVIYSPPNTFRKAKTKYMKVVAFDFSIPGVDHIGLPMGLLIGDMSKYLPYFQSINVEWLKKGLEYHLKCKGYLILILHMLFTEIDERPRNNIVEEIKSYIVENYERNLSVSEIAEVMGVSTVYCGAIFKKFEGCTINFYINQIRINQAVNYMTTTWMNNSEVAYRIGFNDVYYFSRMFKKMKGVSPTDFRKTFVKKYDR